MSSIKFTCITCKIQLENSVFHKEHYKSEWHRYNLHRKTFKLPPITNKEYEEKLILQEQIKNNEKSSNVFCHYCKKNFTTKNSYENHLNSKNHKNNLRVFETNEEISSSSKEIEKSNEKDQDDLDTDSEIEELDSDEWSEEGQENPILQHNCLFCSHHSKNITKNVKHMCETHSFFIPDIDFLVDLKGLLEYLGEKVASGFMCIWCQLTFRSFESVQQHMCDKNHTKMLFEGEALTEYADFYDYSKSYPDDGNDADMEVDVPVIDDSSYQLVLPSGAIIGHRSLFRYYKQNLKTDQQLQAKKINHLHKFYHAIGWKTSEYEAINRRARDVNCFKRHQQRHFMKLGVKANKLQKHFRPQVNF